MALDDAPQASISQPPVQTNDSGFFFPDIEMLTPQIVHTPIMSTISLPNKPSFPDDQGELSPMSKFMVATSAMFPDNPFDNSFQMSEWPMLPKVADPNLQDINAFPDQRMLFATVNEGTAMTPALTTSINANSTQITSFASVKGTTMTHSLANTTHADFVMLGTPSMDPPSNNVMSALANAPLVIDSATTSLDNVNATTTLAKSASINSATMTLNTVNSGMQDTPSVTQPSITVNEMTDPKTTAQSDNKRRRRAREEGENEGLVLPEGSRRAHKPRRLVDGDSSWAWVPTERRK
jgi:hypothetical protein